MKVSPLEFNKNNDVTFRGLKVPDIADLKTAKRMANCGLNGLEKNLVETIEKKAPGLLSEADGLKYVKGETIGTKFAGAFKSLINLPLDVIDGVAKWFPKSKLNNAEFIQKHRAKALLDDEVRALQGIHENGIKFIKKAMPKDGKYPTGDCSPYCHSICDPVTEDFNKLLNDSMEQNNSIYDTKKERFSARIISGFTAALFLGSDFFNKSIMQGKTPDEAKKEQHKKQGQEVKENICEGITQFAVFACFSKFINSKVWASAIVATGIGLVSRIISRSLSGMPLGRIDAPTERKKTSFNVPSVKEYIESIKDNKPIEFGAKTITIKDDKEKKKPLLSFKNILLLCAASIAGGYGLRFLGKHTSLGKSFNEKISAHTEKLNKKFIEEAWGDKKSLTDLGLGLILKGEQNLGNEVLNLTKRVQGDTDKILLGTRYKTTKLFGKIEVQTKDLNHLKTAPFRFIKELVSYPYKIATKLEGAIKNARLKSRGIEPPKKPKVLEDFYDIKNLFLRFKEFEAKSGGDDEKLVKEFGEYVHKMRLASNNNITSSKNDNSKIAVIAQTLGTLTGIGFNMNDQFNSTVRNGGTKNEGEKDARERGLNKFLRMTVQVIISGGLNDLFTKQYNNSIAKAGLIVGASTILTDMASRFLSAMPIKKMSKEELEKYQQEHKTGLMSGYYKAIDKLTD